MSRIWGYFTNFEDIKTIWTNFGVYVTDFRGPSHMLGLFNGKVVLMSPPYHGEFWGLVSPSLREFLAQLGSARLGGIVMPFEQ